MRVRDVIEAVDAWAPPAYAYPWDRAGLHTGHPSSDVSSVLVALTMSRETLEAAHEAGAEMIVSHHPLIWEPLKTLREDQAEGQLCVDLARAGIACYSAHTNLDVVPEGVNWVLADRLELAECAPLFPVKHAEQVKLTVFVPESDLAQVREAVCQAGAGIIGDYTHCSFSAPGVGTFVPGEGTNPHVGRRFRLNEENERRFETLVPKALLSPVLEALFDAHPYEEPAYDLVELANEPMDLSLGLRGRLAKETTLAAFAAFTRRALEISHVRIVGEPRQRVQRIAILGGAGGSTLEKAPPDVDVFVTGDVKYHEAIAARERGLAVIDAGHHGTEKWIVPALARYLKDELEALHVATFMEPEIFHVVTK